MRVFSAENTLLRIFRRSSLYTTKVVAFSFTIIRVGLQRSGVVVQRHQVQNRDIETEARETSDPSGKASVAYLVTCFALRYMLNWKYAANPTGTTCLALKEGRNERVSVRPTERNSGIVHSLYVNGSRERAEAHGRPSPQRIEGKEDIEGA
jgi:hypothetical protein